MSALENIDYGLLAEQRLEIVNLIDDLDDWPEERRHGYIEALEGVLSLLDAITDQAIAQGVTTEAEALMKPQGQGWYIEPLMEPAPTYGPFADEIEASEAMDEQDLSDSHYKIVWRESVVDGAAIDLMERNGLL